MNSSRILFIGGVFTAGKTFVSKKLSEKFKITHLSCGAIIDEMKNKINNFVKPRDLLVNDITGNQALLIDGLEKKINKGDNIIIDGHFALLDNSLQIETIENEVFKKISPKGIIVLKREIPDLIEKFKERYSNTIDEAILYELQTIELESAKNIALELNITCLVAHKSDIDNIFEYTRSIFPNVNHERV